MARLTLALIVAFTTVCSAQKSTIDLEKYRNTNFRISQAEYTVGTHKFGLVNIKPIYKSDTACISAIIIDKRKYVLFDVNVDPASPVGLVVPAKQPVENGLVVLKASSDEGKTFVFLANGKLVTLPGALVFADQDGGNLYCVLENASQYRLTVFDYKNVRIRIPTTEISKPVKWYSSGLSFYFTTEQEKGYYTIDMFTKSVSKTDSIDGELVPVSYIEDFSKFDRQKCCGESALKKK